MLAVRAFGISGTPSSRWSSTWAGTGQLAVAAARAAGQVIAVDVSPVMLAFGR